MKEFAKVIAYLRNTVVNQVPPSWESKRITSKDIFGLAGSATCENALNLLKATNDENKTAAGDDVARKEQTQPKKATDTHARVIVGSKLIDKIHKFGDSILGNLKLVKYYALLVHAHPKSSVKKPNKLDSCLTKASELKSARSALRLYHARCHCFRPDFFRSRSRGASTLSKILRGTK